jgi:NADPH:quinone reductase-like Zn-dependent oxidoreductase
MKAVFVERGKLVFRDCERPQPLPDQLIVAPAALSLNRGEVSYSRAGAPDGFRPGWDFAGFVRRAAADGSGPAEGKRVVGMVERAAWAEEVAVSSRAVAELPDGVSFAEAACLPIAGLTALYALGCHGDLLARRVLITGATGGVGHLAIRLAKLMGAHVVAAIRSEGQVRRVVDYGADETILVGDDCSAIAPNGPYDLIVESVGGAVLGACLNAIAPDGACVVIGVSGPPVTSFDSFRFFVTGGVRIYDLMLFRDMLKRESAATGLRRLVSLTAAGRLRPDISVERPWDDIEAVASDLTNRQFSGKAVLHLQSEK